MEMKKFLILTLSVLLLCALCTSVMAVSIGTVINHTLYTDILADIDGHLLRSYNVDNHTVIVAEDLRAYGFDVIWHGDERWLEVVRPVVDGEPKTPAAYPDFTPSTPAGKIGTPAHDILYTDIVTTVAGDQVESWNINGETVFAFRELERYGEILYDNEARRSMYVTEPFKVFAGCHAVEQQPAAAEWVVSSQMTADTMTVTFTVNQDKDSWSGFIGKDKSDANLDLIWSVETKPSAKITLAFYPEQFRPGKTLRRDLFDALSSLPIPSAADTIDFTNTTEVRESVAQNFRVTLNGKAVTGDLWQSQGNGHTDFTFLFDKGFEVKPGDVICVTVNTGAASVEEG